MPATDRETFVLGVLDGLAEDLDQHRDSGDARWFEGYGTALNTARSLIRGEIAEAERLDEESGVTT